MDNKNSNKSLFLYTALIFFVAIILIIIEFFGQTNVQKSQPPIDEPSPTAVSGITEKAAVLSEENTKLMQQVADLKKQIEEDGKAIEELNQKIYESSAVNDNDKLLLHAYDCKLSDNTDDLSVILSSINYDSLTDEQKVIYDKLSK